MNEVDMTTMLILTADEWAVISPCLFDLDAVGIRVDGMIGGVRLRGSKKMIGLITAMLDARNVLRNAAWDATARQQEAKKVQP